MMYRRLIISIALGFSLFSCWKKPPQPKPTQTKVVEEPRKELPPLPPPNPESVQTLKTLSQTFAQVAQQVNPSVVSIRTFRKGRRVEQDLFSLFGSTPKPQAPRNPQKAPTLPLGSGSGFVLDEKGYIMTNNHVIDEADEIKIKFDDKKEFLAKVVASDARLDLAILKIEPGTYKLTAVALGNSDEMRVGEWVMAIGNPFGLDHTVTVGIISAKDRETNEPLQQFLQTDASINPGNSGGPLINLNGEVVGINTAILGPRGNIGIGFALPSNLAKRAWQTFQTTGGKNIGVYSSIGVALSQITIERKKFAEAPTTEDGIMIADFAGRNTPAEKAGLQRGDIIVSIDGKPVQEINSLKGIILAKPPGTTINLGILRSSQITNQLLPFAFNGIPKNRSITIKVTAEDRPTTISVVTGNAANLVNPPSDQEEDEE